MAKGRRKKASAKPAFTKIDHSRRGTNGGYEIHDLTNWEPVEAYLSRPKPTKNAEGVEVVFASVNGNATTEVSFRKLIDIKKQLSGELRAQSHLRRECQETISNHDKVCRALSFAKSLIHCRVA